MADPAVSHRNHTAGDEPCDALLTASRSRQPNQTPPSLTRSKQRAFLDALRRTGSYADAIAFAQVGDSTPTQWAQRSEAFAKMWEEAKKLGERLLLERYESSLDDTLLDKCKEINDIAKTQNLRMFRMKRLDPRYRDNATVNVAITGPSNCVFDMGQDTPTGSDQDTK